MRPNLTERLWAWCDMFGRTTKSGPLAKMNWGLKHALLLPFVFLSLILMCCFYCPLSPPILSWIITIINTHTHMYIYICIDRICVYNLFYSVFHSDERLASVSLQHAVSGPCLELVATTGVALVKPWWMHWTHCGWWISRRRGSIGMVMNDMNGGPAPMIPNDSQWS